MPCLYHLDEEFAQDFIESNLDRRLTPKEVNRIKLSLIENDCVNHHLWDIIYIAGKDAMDNSKGQWDEIDADYENGCPLFPDLDCKEK